MNRSYKLSLACGAIPLLAGSLIFILWYFTRWLWLMVAGYITLLIGSAFFLVGSIALIRFFWLASRAGIIPRRQLWRSTIGCACLLLANFPIAAGIATAAFAIETCYTVDVHNSSPHTLEEVRVFGGGCDVLIGTIQPGDHNKISFWINFDGELKFTAMIGSLTYQKTIDGYVTNNLGGHVTVTVHSDGTITVSPPTPNKSLKADSPN